MYRETSKGRLELISDGKIIKQTYNNNTTIDLTEAKLILELTHELLDGRRLLLLNDMRAKVAFDRDARDYFRKNTPQDAVVAFIIDSKIGEVAINFFLKFNSPDYKLRIFNELEEGLQWLLEEGAAQAET